MLLVVGLLRELLLLLCFRRRDLLVQCSNFSGLMLGLLVSAIRLVCSCCGLLVMLLGFGLFVLSLVCLDWFCALQVCGLSSIAWVCVIGVEAVGFPVL